MAQLLVRNIEEEVVRALRVRAAAHGRSAEEEHREILRQALRPAPKRNIKEFLESMPAGVEDRELERPRDLGRDVDL